MSDVKIIRILNDQGIPDSIDLTTAGIDLNADNFKITSSSVTASKPAKLDANKKFTSGNIDLTTEVTGVLPVANGGTNSSTALNNNRIMKSSSGSVVEHTAITIDRALISDAQGIPAHSIITKTELETLDNITGNIQAQLNAMQSGLRRRMKVISVVADPSTTYPGNGLAAEALGQRYIVQAAIGANNANWGGDNDAIAKDDIIEHDGTKWFVSWSPAEGDLSYVDDSDKDACFVDDGSPHWELRNVRSNYLADGKIWIGNVSGEAIERTPSGEATMTNAGAITLSNSAVIAKVLTAFAAGSGYETVTAADSIFTALQKIVGNFINNVRDTIKFNAVAGEILAVNKTYPVRLAVNGETAGRLYIATKDQQNSPNKFWVVGVVQVGGTQVAAGDPIVVTKFGPVSLKSGDVNPIATDVGLPMFLGKNGGSLGLLKCGDPADSDVTIGEKFASNIVGSVFSRSAIVTETILWVDAGPQGFQGVSIREV